MLKDNFLISSIVVVCAHFHCTTSIVEYYVYCRELYFTTKCAAG